MPADLRTNHLQLQGAPAFVAGNGERVGLEAKDALLLAYVAIEGPTPRGKLAALLWPEADGDRARANLRQRLLRLRRSVGRELLMGGDVARLCDDVEADVATVRDGMVLGELQDGVAGELADWLDGVRSQRRTTRLRAVADECARLELSGELGPALVAAQRLVELEPTSEHGHRRLMRLHYLRGDRAAALAAFDRCCDVLQESLAIAPDVETEALRAAIVSGSIRSDIAQRRPLPVSVMRPPRLIARDAEWRAMCEDWSGGKATLLAGESGLGKSRLLGDFAMAHPDAIAVDARPGDSRVPHSLMSRLLRQGLARIDTPLPALVLDQLARLLPELGIAAPMTGDIDRARFVNAVEMAMRQAAAAGVSGLVVDDLQFADDASVDMLQHLRSAIPELRWVVAFRPDELGASATAFHEIETRGNDSRLHVLRPLADDDARLLVASLSVGQLDASGVTSALVRKTGGNPMYLLETVKLLLSSEGSGGVVHLPAALPTASNVAHLIQQRLGRLSPMALKLARCAAIAGPAFSSELASHVLGLRPLDLSDAWTELEAGHVLQDDAFAHDLIFESARASVPSPIARQLHGEIAAFLAARAGEPAHIAQHWLDAKEPSRAIPWLVAAADRVATTWRKAEESALVMQAARIGIAEGVDRDATFSLLRRAHQSCLESQLGSPVHLECIELLEAEADDPLQRAHAHSARAETLAQLGDGKPAEVAARAGLAALEGLEGHAIDELHVELTSALANSLFVLDRPDEGLAAMRAVQPRLLRLGDRHLEIEHYGSYGTLLDVCNQATEAQATMRHVISLARSAGDRVSELAVLLNLASSFADIGKAQAAMSPIGEALQLATDFPELRTSALYLENIAGCARRDLGHYQAALALLESSLAKVERDAPNFAAAPHLALSRLWCDLGQPARAQRQLDCALAVEAAPAYYLARAHLFRAQMALIRGERQRAAEALLQAEHLIVPTSRYAVRAQALLIGAALRLDPGSAYSVAAEVALDAGRLQMHCVRIDALVSAAQHALSSDRRGEAAIHAAEALALWPEHAPDTVYVGDVWLTAVRSFGGVSDPRALSVLSTARNWIADTAARHVAQPVRESFLHRNPANRALMAGA